MRQESFTAIVCVLLVLTAIMSVFMLVEAVTWSVNIKQLTTYEFYDGHPAFTQTSDGRVWLVWSKEILGNLTLYYKTSSNLGRTWSDEMNLTTIFAPGHNQNPSITQAQNGTIWVAWASDRPPPPSPPIPDFQLDASPQNLIISQGESNNSTIIVTSMNDFNGTVNLSVLSEPAGVTTAFDPTMVVPPPNGTANSTLTISVSPLATPGNYTLTIQGRNSHLFRFVSIYLEITVAGGTSQPITDIDRRSPSSISNPIMDYEIYYKVSHDNGATPTKAIPEITDIDRRSPSSISNPIMDYEIYYKVSHDNGATWSNDVQLIANGVDDMRPAIMQLTNGTIMIFWQAYTSGDFNIVYKTTVDGISWSNTTQLTTDSAHDKSPAVTQTKDGNIWVVWLSERTGDNEIFYKIYDGVSWSGDTRLTYSPNSDLAPAIVQAVNEEILIFWSTKPDIATGVYDIYYKHLVNGSSWSESIPFAVSTYQDLWPATIRTHDTEIWVAWMSETEVVINGETYTNMDIYYKTSMAGDVNEDNEVNDLDLTIVLMSYGFFEGQPGYNPDADINKDGFVDIQDLAIVAFHLGES